MTRIDSFIAWLLNLLKVNVRTVRYACAAQLLLLLIVVQHYFDHQWVESHTPERDLYLFGALIAFAALSALFFGWLGFSRRGKSLFAGRSESYAPTWSFLHLVKIGIGSAACGLLLETAVYLFLSAQGSSLTRYFFDPVINPVIWFCMTILLVPLVSRLLRSTKSQSGAN